MPKPPKATPRSRQKYALSITFAPEEVQIIELLEADMRLRRTQIIKLLLADEAKRRGLR